MPVGTTKIETAPASAGQGLLLPAKTAAIHDYAHPPPPIPHILLAQNLSSKWIVPTNNTVKVA